MLSALIPQLHLPGGGAALQLIRADRRWQGHIVRGEVYAPGRGFFPIREGILDLLPTGAGPLTPAQWSNTVWPTAVLYERWWRRSALSLLGDQPFSVAQEVALLQDYLGPPRPGLVVDLAASTALYGRALAPSWDRVGATVVAIDLAFPMLRAARGAAGAESLPNIAFVRARAEALPFADGQVVGVVCGGSLNEFGAQGLRPVLQELRRVLAPTAPAVLMHLTAARSPQGRVVQQMLTALSGIVFPSLAETNALFQAAGFALTRQQQMGIVAFSRLALRPHV